MFTTVYLLVVLAVCFFSAIIFSRMAYKHNTPGYAIVAGLFFLFLLVSGVNAYNELKELDKRMENGPAGIKQK